MSPELASRFFNTSATWEAIFHKNPKKERFWRTSWLVNTWRFRQWCPQGLKLHALSLYPALSISLIWLLWVISSVQLLSHVLTLCNSMDHSTPGFPVHHQLPEFTQTHVHWVGDAIQPSHPLLSPSPPAPNPSQHQSLFQWVNSSHEVAKVLEFQL